MQFKSWEHINHPSIWWQTTRL